MKRFLFLLTLGVAGAWFVRTYCYESILIASPSMEPRIKMGRHVLVNKWIYRFGPPKRGDVVLFPSPLQSDKGLVKRVIGVAGDEIRLVNKAVYLNGMILDEIYVQHTRAGELLRGDNLNVGKVPEGNVFVMGDNRDESNDSRDWIDPATGEHIFFVPIKNIQGKLTGVR